MDLVFQAVVMGIVQGLTEFLPVSSSAHLILVPQLLGWDDAFINSASFDVMLHMGTLVALLVYFWRDVLRLMVVKDKVRIWIPAALAFGDKPRRGQPKGDLIYDLELLAIE